jgi:hypothetical protein
MSRAIELVTPAELRRIFNDSGLWDEVAAGRLVEQKLKNRPPNPENKQPPGTRSISAFICSEDERGRRTRLALVHYYRLPDGTINNRSGLPDPKWCIVDGVTYELE